MKKIAINTDYITLGQFLKFAGIIGSGAYAKTYLIENVILVNNEEESRRGRKLRANDIVKVMNTEYIIEQGEE